MQRGDVREPNKLARGARQRRLHKRRGLFAAALLGAGLVAGCATQSVPQIQHAFIPAKHRKVRVEQCVDRSGYTGNRNLGEEATQAILQKVKASNVFEFSQDALLVLTCDVEAFAEGSAIQRWALPGWGATATKVAVVVWEKPEDKLLGVLRSQSKVEGGGLYTIGADQYILGVAVADIVKQLEEWAGGGPSMNRR